MLDILILALIAAAFIAGGFYARSIGAMIEPKHENRTIKSSG
jgi:hypothetical protein